MLGAPKYCFTDVVRTRRTRQYVVVWLVMTIRYEIHGILLLLDQCFEEFYLSLQTLTKAPAPSEARTKSFHGLSVAEFQLRVYVVLSVKRWQVSSKSYDLVN